MASSCQRRSPVLRSIAASLTLAAGLLPAVAVGADVAAVTTGPAPQALTESPGPGTQTASGDSAWWHSSVAVFATLWDDARARLTDDMPDWLQHLSRRAPAPSRAAAGTAYVVLQDDRADGKDLVTLRYQLAEQGSLRAYAGAGVNHTRYFADDPAAGPSLLTRRNRQSDVGATAELGAELALGEQVHLNADLRWVDLDDQADLLHTAFGPVAADPVTFGISLGYRFR